MHELTFRYIAEPCSCTSVVSEISDMLSEKLRTDIESYGIFGHQYARVYSYKNKRSKYDFCISHDSVATVLK